MKLKLLAVAAGLCLGTHLFAVPINITVSGGQSVEAFVYNYPEASLSLIGLYDFKNGEVHNGTLYSSGAIFIRKPGHASWDYAYVLNFNDHTYTLYDKFITLNCSDAPGSPPWSVNPAASHALGTGSFNYSTDLSDPYGLGLHQGFGATHNQIDLNLDLLPEGFRDSFDAHFTASRGQNDIEGHYAIGAAVPLSDGGTTGSLLALTLLPLACAHRRFRQR